MTTPPEELRKLHATAMRVYAKYLKGVKDIRGRKYTTDERTMLIIGFDAGWRAAADAIYTHDNNLRTSEVDADKSR